jgi:hypothetical protein
MQATEKKENDDAYNNCTDDANNKERKSFLENGEDVLHAMKRVAVMRGVGANVIDVAMAGEETV